MRASTNISTWLFAYRWKVERYVCPRQEKRRVDKLFILRVPSTLSRKKASKQIGLVQGGRQNSTIIFKVGHWLLGLSDAAKSYSKSPSAMATAFFVYNLAMLFA